MTKLEQQLKEEQQRWAMKGMTFAGVPAVFKGVPGISVELLETDLRASALVKLLLEKEIFTEEEANEMYQRCMLEKMTKIREAFEEKERAKMLVARQRLLGPDGQPMGNGS